MSQHQDHSDTCENAEPNVLTIKADIAGSFTYASFQNAIPVLRSIIIDNPTSNHFVACKLTLISNPPFLRAKTWTIDRLLSGDSLSISDRKIDLDAAYLAGLDEAERGEISLRLVLNEQVLAEHNVIVRLLARDEWGGVTDMAQLLPAFVMPNDPSISRILRSAAEQLTAHGHSSALDGYQSGNPQRTFLLSAAVYSAISGFGIHYAEPPASFETRGQKIRRPSTIVTDGLATCLDLTLLITAALEAVGLNPVVLMFNGHASVGVWLTQRSLANSIETDAMEIRKALASKEMMVFETTGLTQRPPMLLQNASALIERRIADTSSPDFVAAIDICRSRSGGITPLASHLSARLKYSEVEEVVVEPAALPIPPAPAFDAMPVALEEQKPTTAAGRIDRWQKKLLDLSLRNRLLNFPDTKKTIPFLCPNISYLEDRLAAGAKIRVISLPEQNPLGARDETLYREIRGEDLQRRFASDALQRDELASTLDAKSLETRLIDLYRQVRNDLAEGGANTLFLAIGFLRWKQKPEDERSYRAPLLLVPVKLDRSSASSRFNLRFHEDEPRFNATLLQFLGRDFDLSLPQFLGPLPSDGSGVDVPRLLGLMRQAVRDVPGMEVIDETALSTFSFAKFLMWKDLVERTDALRQNRVVKHLIDTPEQSFDAGSNRFVDERDIDKHYAPSDIISLLPADSSQITASLAAAEGRDFVIVGPPGTGKSQTIANMIAHCLSVGKTVLFVAEKAAALNVVYRRLREQGLGDHCLELHSSKTDRKLFLGQLKKSWQNSSHFDETGWVTISEKLRVRRDQLNAYVDALHRIHSNGLSAYIAMGVALRSREHYAPQLSFSSKDAHDAGMRHELEEIADEIGRIYSSIEHRPVLALVDIGEWSSSWQEQLIAATIQLRERIAALLSAHSAFEIKLQLSASPEPALDGLERLSAFAQSLVETAGADHSIAFDRDFSQFRDAQADLAGAIQNYRELELTLPASFTREVVREIPLEEIENEWRIASSSVWPMSWLGQRRIRKVLQTYATAGTPDPATDLAKLRLMQVHALSMESNALAAKPSGFAGLDTDLNAVERRLAGATRIRESLTHLGRPVEELRNIIRAIALVLQSGSADDPVREAARHFVETSKAFHDSLRNFKTASGVDVFHKQSNATLSDISTLLTDLIGARDLLRNWSAWCQIRQEAKNKGLGCLIDDLESGTVPPDKSGATFQLAYARWWLPQTLDADPVLRNFRHFQHEHAIEEFRQIDDMVRAATSGRVVRALAHHLPPVQGVPRNSELGLLRHQMELLRPSRSIREMIEAMPKSFTKLAPCMLMSPLSIAQYLPSNQALFDVVIFDEASQITTWDAVGAIARAHQTIIVGDPKQLPPTNFFGRNDDEEDVVEHERDLESILDEVKAAGIPVRDLRWHYRSRNESLIAFSNHHYYQNRLITFPSPSVDDQAVQLREVPNGIYDRGKSRTNRVEAYAIVDEAVKRMRDGLALEPENRLTLGIITFNAQQQSLIQDLLDEARRDDPALEWFFAEDRIEPTIVKNLENVQGDERDIILFSITFNKDAAGKRTMDFGALNRDGGERRLNVAVTRARCELLVFSGFTADQIDIGRTKALGVHHLKSFLDFAKRGAIALPAQEQGSMGQLESPFEEAVAAELGKRGWHLVPQVGISGFRIDIGVRHPDLAGAYLAGVECDGATYHRSATARDRDKVREQVLRGLGWNILRVWSTDWWYSPQGAADRLHDALSALLQQSRRRAEEEQERRLVVGPNQTLDERQTEQIHDASITEDKCAAAMAPLMNETASQEDLIPMRLMKHNTGFAEAITPQTRIKEQYHMTDLSMICAEPDRFEDASYQSTLKKMVNAVIDCEAPLREDVLAQRIARAHGWLRTGNRIREQILRHLKEFDRTSEATGNFIWKKGTVSNLISFRPSEETDYRRPISEIPIAELAGAAISQPAVLENIDPALSLARAVGVERLASTARQRLDEALERARSYLAQDS